MFKVYEKRMMMYETYTKWMEKGWAAGLLFVCLGTPFSIICLAIFCLTYPVLTLIVKLVNMFTKNKRMKALAIHSVSFEGLAH